MVNTPDEEKIQQVQGLTEEQIRAIVGAPTIEESKTCMCGESLNTCPDAYVHMTSGV